MGTVGIAFGSPTSGQGFDVSSTVSQLVANLQAVETPWKAQLTSLESEDTALTSIGTDLSSLSTALQSLTDFEGVLSEKQGSSSDESVLQLTAAASNAVAGSHTVVVSRLAQTSSQYSGVVSTTDTLSGTLTLTVGSGAAQTITIDSSDNTLASLAATINSSNLGVTANVITTSGGERLSLVSQTSGAAGQLTVGGSLQGAAAGTIGFTQGQAGQDAQLTVDGVAITSASNTVTNAIQGVTIQLLSSAPSTDVQIEITNNNSDVESALNSFVTAYNKVIGDLNTQEGKDSSGNAEPLFGNPAVATIQEDLQSALAFLQAANAVGTTSAIGTLDTFSGSLSIQVGSGSAQTVTVAAGSTLAQAAAAINTANIGVTASVITSGSTATLSLTNAKSTDTITVNSSGLTDTTSGTAVTFGSARSNSVTSFTQLGLSTNSDGTLSLDTDTLENALNSNYQDVVNFFQPSASFTSFGGNLSTAIDNLGNSAPNGAVYLTLQQDSAEESSLNTSITNEDTQISAEQAKLTTELNAANYTLEQIPSEIDQINEIYSAITGYNEKS
ncbi:MAG TPA: flagellar filament capping protein FliD [Silvibacterium sp.]|nr:flagellar filament capping protein FliD [Silvibacterium sp.]